MSRTLVVLAATLLAHALAPAASAAPPDVPTQVSYQGVLLDTAGQPRSGNVDLTLRIWDALSGGTLVYKQVFTTVPLSDGVFTVRLGPQGAATDAPANPLTTSLADALGGDAGATSPARFLEVTVGTEGALLRSQILATPYALRAVSADSAETAAVADNVTAVNGLDAGVLNQLYEYGNSDGSGPPNTDPREGTADSDGDGAMNFIDPDNDNDSIPDGVEENNGSDLNLLTPTLSSLEPSAVLTFAPAPVALSGLHFDPSMTVSFDGAPISASNVTATSAEIQPAPGHPLGSFPVFVQLANGERSLDRMLEVVSTPAPGVTLPFDFDSTVSVSVRDIARIVIGNHDDYAVDLQGDGSTDQLVPFDLLPDPSSSITPPQIAVAWGSDGRLIGLRCAPDASGCQIQVIRDLDGDHVLTDTGADEVLLGPSYTGTELKLWGPSVRTDASGNAVAGYVIVDAGGAGQPTVLHDRNGDGAFAAGAPETVVIANLGVTPGNFGKLAIDPAGRVAYAHVAAGPSLRVSYDRNGDGDYADNVAGSPETFTAFNAATTHVGRFCGGIAFDGAGRLAAVFAESIASQVRVLRDMNGDGDFSDGGDIIDIEGSSTTGCDIAGHPTGGLAVVHAGAGAPTGVELLIDRNSDGDFDDANETQGIAPGGARLGVVFSDAGRAWVAGTAGVFIDPF